jgi:hypothetical protein
LLLLLLLQILSLCTLSCTHSCPFAPSNGFSLARLPMAAARSSFTHTSVTQLLFSFAHPVRILCTTNSDGDDVETYVVDLEDASLVHAAVLNCVRTYIDPADKHTVEEQDEKDKERDEEEATDSDGNDDAQPSGARKVKETRKQKRQRKEKGRPAVHGRVDSYAQHVEVFFYYNHGSHHDELTLKILGKPVDVSALKDFVAKRYPSE